MPAEQQLTIIPEKQFAPFDELMGKLRTAWQQTPDAPDDLMQVASMLLPNVRVLSDEAIRERAKDYFHVEHSRFIGTRLLGNMDAEVDFRVEFRKGEDKADFLVLTRRSPDQEIDLAFSFIDHEFRGAQLTIINNIQRERKNEIFFITDKGVIARKGFISPYEEQPKDKVNIDKLIGILTAAESLTEPLGMNKLLEDITVSSK